MASGKFLKTCMVGAIVALTSMAALADEGPTSKASYYSARMNLTVDGTVIASPQVTGEFGKQVEITLSSKDQSHGWRLSFMVDEPFVTPDGIPAVRSKAQLFEVNDKSQVLAAEPELVLPLGADPSNVSFPIDGKAKRTASLSMSVEVRSITDLKQLLGEAFDSPKDGCISQAAPAPAGPRCCGIHCADGDSATCCGAIECCVCGGCCRP